MIPPIKCEYLPNLFDIAFISNVFIAIVNTTISSIKKKKTKVPMPRHGEHLVRIRTD